MGECRGEGEEGARSRVTGGVLLRVRFLQSGGVVGAVRGADLESALMQPGDARELAELVKASGIVASGEHLSPGRADLRLYEIHVDCEHGTISATFDDETVPEAARALVSFLRRNSKPRTLE